MQLIEPTRLELYSGAARDLPLAVRRHPHRPHGVLGQSFCGLLSFYVLSFRLAGLVR